MKQEKHHVGNSFAKRYWTIALCSIAGSLFADSNFSSALGKALGIGVLIAFVSCVFFILDGIWKYRQGASYNADIVGLIVSAGAVAIVGVLFAAFGMSGAAITPSF